MFYSTCVSLYTSSLCFFPSILSAPSMICITCVSLSFPSLGGCGGCGEVSSNRPASKPQLHVPTFKSAISASKHQVSYSLKPASQLPSHQSAGLLSAPASESASNKPAWSSSSLLFFLLELALEPPSRSPPEESKAQCNNNATRPNKYPVSDPADSFACVSVGGLADSCPWFSVLRLT